jgi:hypothetical protein
MHEPDAVNFAGGEEMLIFMDKKEQGAALLNAAPTEAIMLFTNKGIINRF